MLLRLQLQAKTDRALQCMNLRAIERRDAMYVSVAQSNVGISTVGILTIIDDLFEHLYRE